LRGGGVVVTVPAGTTFEYVLDLAGRHAAGFRLQADHHLGDTQFRLGPADPTEAVVAFRTPLRRPRSHGSLEQEGDQGKRPSRFGAGCPAS
jgi:hypothetical protein